MKARIANLMICRHFNQWIETIDDPKVRKMIEAGTILTGGAIVTLLTENKVNDFDFYFRDKATAEAVARYYVEKFKANPPARFASGGKVELYVQVDADRVRIIAKSAGIVGETASQKPYAYFEGDANPENQDAYIEAAAGAAEESAEILTESKKAEAEKDKPKFRPLWLTENAISLSNRTQLVIRFYGEPSEIHENYDFAHCTNYWTSWERRVVLNAVALECILSRELRYIGSKYPICSMFRVRKFIQRGWTITAGQMLKIVWQIKSLDLTKFEVLHDQLTVVDVAYFHQLVNALHQHDPSKVDETYLMTLLDRVL